MAREGKNRFTRPLFTEDHEAVRDSFRRFLTKEIAPHHAQWERDGIMPHEVYEKVGAQGYMCMAVPPEYGGQGIDDFRYNTVLTEECLALGLGAFNMSIGLVNDVALPYFLECATEEQKRRWFPGMVAGKLVSAIAMTEPGAGSDLAGVSTTAIRQGDHYLVNGAKTFITNGVNADLVITVVKTDPGNRHGGISLLVIERGMPGFERGRNLDKLGLHGQDTAELFFNDVKVPLNNLLGAEGKGFLHLVDNLPQERLGIALAAIATCQACLGWTLDYVKQRKAFGRPIGTFQHSRMVIAEMRTEIEIAQVFIDRCIEQHLKRQLTAEQAAMAKWWCTELQGRVTDRCVQLHGGYGYMNEYPVTRAYADARITRIFGGTNEIMKEIIGKAEGLAD